MQTVVMRRSIRSFKPEPVPSSVMEDMLNETRFCPSAMNSRTTQFVVIGRKTMDACAVQVAGALS